jgi:hypothetical protein
MKSRLREISLQRNRVQKARTRLSVLVEGAQANTGCVSVEIKRLKAVLATPAVSGQVASRDKYLIFKDFL